VPRQWVHKQKRVVGECMHAHAWHMRHAHMKAYLTWAASAGGGEIGHGGRGRGSTMHVQVHQP